MAVRAGYNHQAGAARRGRTGPPAIPRIPSALPNMHIKLPTYFRNPYPESHVNTVWGFTGRLGYPSARNYFLPYPKLNNRFLRDSSSRGLWEKNIQPLPPRFNPARKS